jgi:hypothetical protein
VVSSRYVTAVSAPGRSAGIWTGTVASPSRSWTTTRGTGQRELLRTVSAQIAGSPRVTRLGCTSRDSSTLGRHATVSRASAQAATAAQPSTSSSR